MATASTQSTATPAKTDTAPSDELLAGSTANSNEKVPAMSVPSSSFTAGSCNQIEADSSISVSETIGADSTASSSKKMLSDSLTTDRDEVAATPIAAGGKEAAVGSTATTCKNVVVDSTAPNRVEVGKAFVSAFQISPVPKANTAKRRRGGRRGKTVILTGSPYKNELTEQLKESQARKRKVPLTKQQAKVNKPVVSVQRKAKIRDVDESETNPEMNKCSSDECLYCGNFYSQSLEGWIQCTMCRKWAHDSCAGVDDNEDTFECEICSQ